MWCHSYKFIKILKATKMWKFFYCNVSKNEQKCENSFTAMSPIMDKGDLILIRPCFFNLYT